MALKVIGAHCRQLGPKWPVGLPSWGTGGSAVITVAGKWNPLISSHPSAVSLMDTQTRGRWPQLEKSVCLLNVSSMVLILWRPLICDAEIVQFVPTPECPPTYPLPRTSLPSIPLHVFAQSRLFATVHEDSNCGSHLFLHEVDGQLRGSVHYDSFSFCGPSRWPLSEALQEQVPI